MRVARAQRFHGRFRLPGDKSVCHRLAILGALAEGETEIANFSTAADCDSTLRCLSALGVEVRRDGGTVSVLGAGPEALSAPAGPLDAGNSGSTLRMLAGVLAGRPFRTVLTGDASLCRRPVERVAAPLRAMGARAETTDGRPPLTLSGGPLKGISWELPVASAQVKTAILLAGLQANGRTLVSEPLPSRDHTERLLPIFGVPVEIAGSTVSVQGPQTLRAVRLSAPGDISSAAFLVAAALVVPNAAVRVENVLLNPRRIAFLDVLRHMGGRVEMQVESSWPEPVGWIEARSSVLTDAEVPPQIVPELIDEIPALAAAAAASQAELVVSGAAELRVKESDRIAALADGLGRMGARVVQRPDGFTLRGGRLRGARVDARGDHRIAMALSVAALAADGDTEIEDGACAAVSFPEFYDLLERAASTGAARG